MSIIHPEMMKDMMWAFVNIYKQQGKIPVWHLMGCETDCMVGNPGVIIVADGLNKGYIENKEEAYRLMEDMLTVQELKSITQRLEVAVMLRQKVTYQEIARETGASSATISRVNRALLYGAEGYVRVLDALDAASEEE